MIRKITFTIFSLLFVCACSLGGKKGTPETRQALVFITQQYVGSVIANHYDHAQSMVLWGDYEKNMSSGVSKNLFKIQLEKFSSKFANTPRDKHPLMNLDLKDIEIDGDNAEVVLIKIDDPKQDEIEVSYQWVGRGWLVTKDSLFGNKGIINNSLKN